MPQGLSAAEVEALGQPLGGPVVVQPQRPSLLARAIAESVVPSSKQSAKFAPSSSLMRSTLPQSNGDGGLCCEVGP